ncbi:hypothetical protein DFH06DRAFT_1230091 [Mycena polygramma]|nr:hypothetical protein DFH06DRAFT_1230091 [Mycena polygramma]
MDLAPLTPGAVDAIERSSKSIPITQNFVLQIVSIRAIPHGPQTHYRIILSDGTYFLDTVLAKNVRQRYGSILGLLKNSVVGVDELTWVCIQTKWFVVITEMHPIEERSERIGDPAMKAPDSGSQ